jgi:hypothetical protein
MSLFVFELLLKPILNFLEFLSPKQGFSLSLFSLWKLSLRQILFNFVLGHFTFFL